MSSESDRAYDEPEAASCERRRLQREWWERLAAHPDAWLHRHIKPGEMVMFGMCDADQQCLIEPGLSLHYLVWNDQCEISLHIEDRSARQPDHPLAARPPNDCEKAVFDDLLANKDQIEASFGDELCWRHDCFLKFVINGGYGSPDQQWNGTITRQVDAMNRLHAALLPHATGTAS